MDWTVALIKRAHEGDKAAREQLVEENVGLVWCVVKRFTGRGVETEDLFQIGSIGLLKAIDKFDLQYEVKFSTYAIPMISGEIKRFLRDNGMIKVSRTLKELSFKAFHARERLQKSLGREPDIGELAEELQVEKEELAMAMEAGSEVESLQKPIYQKDGNTISLMEKLKEEKDREEMVLNRLAVSQLLGELEPEERRILYLRYFDDKTQTEIGKEVGISQVQVSRMEKKILKKLRERME